jgi:hypothetical protein
MRQLAVAVAVACARLLGRAYRPSSCYAEMRRPAVHADDLVAV